MLNSKGQSLVLFILIIPILVGIMALVIDVGNMLVQRNHMDNVIEMVYEMAKKEKIDVHQFEKVLNYNLDNYQNEVVIDGDVISVNSTTYFKGIFSKMFGFSGFPIVVKYQYNISFPQNGVENSSDKDSKEV